MEHGKLSLFPFIQVVHCKIINMTFFSVFTYAEVKADPIEPKYRVSFNFFQPTVPGRYPLCEIIDTLKNLCCSTVLCAVPDSNPQPQCLRSR